MGVDVIAEEAHQDGVAPATDLCPKHGGAAGPSVDDQGHERRAAIEGRLHQVVFHERRQIAGSPATPAERVPSTDRICTNVSANSPSASASLGERMQMDAGAVGGRCQLGGGDGAHLSVEVAPEVDVEGGVDRQIGDRQQQPECQRPPERELYPERHPRRPARS